MPSKEQSIIFAEQQSFEAAHKALSVHIAQRRLQQLYKKSSSTVTSFLIENVSPPRLPQ
jgi:hypothetical protein